MIEELIIREGLSSAIRGLDKNGYLNLLKFCTKKLDSLNS